MTKKAQSEIITTVLIILLVLAAVVIVWQVISGTVSEGAKKIQQQSECIDLRIDITKIDSEANTIIIRPSKKINAYRVYVNGEDAAPLGGGLEELSTQTITSNIDFKPGDEIEVVGKIGDTWCSSNTNKKLAGN